MKNISSIPKEVLMATILVVGILIALAVMLLEPQQSLAGFNGSPTSIGAATTTTSTSVTSSTRIMATTSSADGSANYTRVYATICNPNANPVYINLDYDKPAGIGSVTKVIAAAAGYDACWEINDISYQGSITASSTNQTATVISYKQYVQ